MFERDKKLTSLFPQVESLFEIYSSINTPLVAVEENPTEQTRGFIIVLSDRKNEFNFYIFLHLLSSNKGIFYVAERIKEKDYSETKNNVFNFVESMGFLMERVFSLEEGAERAEECIKTLPMFFNNMGKGTEEVIKLDDEEIVEIKDEAIQESDKKNETGTIDEVEILLDEVEKHEKREVKTSETKNKVVGKIQIKSITVQAKAEGLDLKKFEPFFRFLLSC